MGGRRRADGASLEVVSILHSQWLKTMEAAELERLQSEIERVGREINAAEAKLQQVDSTDADGLKYWRTEKEQLRREKEQLRAEKLTILQRFMETTSRATTPGAAEAVFCIVSLVKQGRECRAFPRGTGFAISPKHIFTAWHKCLIDEDSSDMLPSISAVREISPRKGLVESEIVSLNLVASDADEDWAVFARREGDFATHVRICTEGCLPFETSSVSRTIPWASSTLFLQQS